MHKLVLLGCLFLGGFSAVAQGAPKMQPAVVRFNVQLDDNSYVVVDKAAALTVAEASVLVLAADRSTRTGCPYEAAPWDKLKGLVKGRMNPNDPNEKSDRIFVGNNYLAWFDHTMDDGGTSTGWAPSQFPRSGSLAGYWSLNAATKNFRHFYRTDSTVKDQVNNICWNWSRNELIPGSNSPNPYAVTPRFWWDKYAPALEHTLAINTGGRDAIGDPKFNLFSTFYTQASSQSGLTLNTDGAQDGAGGVHYVVSGLMTDWTSNHGVTFPVVDANLNPVLDGSGNPVQGMINYTMEYICASDRIEVIWKFAPTAAASLSNIYVNLWVGYSGLKKNGASVDYACTANGAPNIAHPVAPKVFGLSPIDGQGNYHTYNWVQSSLGLGQIQSNGGINYSSPYSVVSFPWLQAVPCNYGSVIPNRSINVGVITTNSLAPLPASAWFAIGNQSSFTSANPRWRMTNFAAPNSGSGSAADPKAYPFTRFIVNYENSDQQQGIIIDQETAKGSLAPGYWYRSHYSLSTTF